MFSTEDNTKRATCVVLLNCILEVSVIEKAPGVSKWKSTVFPAFVRQTHVSDKLFNSAQNLNRFRRFKDLAFLMKNLIGKQYREGVFSKFSSGRRNK